MTTALDTTEAHEAMREAVQRYPVLFFNRAFRHAVGGGERADDNLIDAAEVAEALGLLRQHCEVDAGMAHSRLLTYFVQRYIPQTIDSDFGTTEEALIVAAIHLGFPIRVDYAHSRPDVAQDTVWIGARPKD